VKAGVGHWGGTPQQTVFSQRRRRQLLATMQMVIQTAAISPDDQPCKEGRLEHVTGLVVVAADAYNLLATFLHKQQASTRLKQWL